MNGLHIVAEFHHCQCAPALLTDAAALRSLCLAACGAPGLTVVAEAFHAFGTPAESHLAEHTWPEQAGVTLDIYVCNFSRDNRAGAETAYASLRGAFQPERIIRRDIERGLPTG